MEILLQEREEEIEYAIEELKEVSSICGHGILVKPVVDTMSGGGAEVVTVKRSVMQEWLCMESGFGLGKETGGTKAGAEMSTRSCSGFIVCLVMGNWVCFRHESYHTWAVLIVSH